MLTTPTRQAREHSLEPISKPKPHSLLTRRSNWCWHLRRIQPIVQLLRSMIGISQMRRRSHQPRTWNLISTVFRCFLVLRIPRIRSATHEFTGCCKDRKTKSNSWRRSRDWSRTVWSSHINLWRDQWSWVSRGQRWPLSPQTLPLSQSQTGVGQCQNVNLS